MKNVLLMGLLPVIVAIIALGCGSNDDEPDAIQEEVEEEIDEQEALDSEPNDDEETSDSEDGPQPVATPDQYVETYQLNYLLCGEDPEGVYEEAGTSDPLEAAEWVGEIYQDGHPAQAGAVAGCARALLGLASEYPE